MEKMGVPDAKARNIIRDLQLAAGYAIDCHTVKLGEYLLCCIIDLGTNLCGLIGDHDVFGRLLRLVGKKI